MTNGGIEDPNDAYNSFTDASTLDGSSDSNSGSSSNTDILTSVRWGDPYFDPMTPKNVTALVGKSAYLSCRVRNLGNKTVRIKTFHQKSVFIFIKYQKITYFFRDKHYKILFDCISIKKRI